MNYKHLDNNDRILIEYLYNTENKSIRQIAFSLNKSPSTISRELKRNSSNGIYESKIANYKSQKRIFLKKFFIHNKYDNFTTIFKQNFEKKYHGVRVTYHKINKLFPEITKPSWRQVYYWISSSRWFIKRKDLIKRKYSKKPKIRMWSKFKNKKVFPYWMRPKYIDLRLTYGHWEVDLIIGRKEHGYSNLLTFTERKSRVNFIAKIATKDPMKTNQCIYKIIKDNKLLVHSITVDNGIEFAKIGILASWAKCKIYVCDPYASYQRGTNEHINGMIRRMWKKKTDFSLLSEKEILDIQTKINEMPRKLFNWKSAFDIYNILK